MSYVVDSQTSGCDSDLAEVSCENASWVVPSKLLSSDQHISSIVLPVFRLEIMEDVFSLLFSRTEHLRDSEDSPECQSDSDPEDRDDPKHSEFVFDDLALSGHCENITDVSDAAAVTHEIPSVENPRVGALTAESRCSPMEASSSSVDGRSDEFSGSQTVSNSSVQCGSECGFLARDYVIRDILMLLRRSCAELSNELSTRLLSTGNAKSMLGNRQTADLQLTELKQRIEALQKHITDAQWRLRITASPSARVSALSQHHHPKQQWQRHKRHHDSVTCKDSDDYSMTSDNAPRENTVVPRMLCRPESLLNLCLAEGRIADAEEVVKVCCYCHAVWTIFGLLFTLYCFRSYWAISILLSSCEHTCTRN